MTRLNARISNRVFVGKELSRNEGFIHAVINFAETVLVIAPFIQWSPVFLRPCVLSFSICCSAFNSTKRVVYYVLSSIFGGKKGALKYLVPHLKKYAKERSDIGEKPVVLLDLFYLVPD